MDYRVDEIDKRILYYLARDARNTAAPAIADEVQVTPATVRNRIQQLEEHGILRGYHAAIDYELIEGRVTYQFNCTGPVPDRDRLAQAALEISGVVTVRELMTGHANLAITAVGTDTDDVSRIASELSDLGLEIEDEGVIEEEYHHPYHPFGPGDAPTGPSLTDFMSLAGGAEVVEFTVSEGAPIAGLTIEEAVSDGLLAEDVLVVSIEREGDAITPKGDTEIQPGDVVSLFSKDPLEKRSLEAFGAQ
ncbi:MAG: DNA-binding Lrp family transcriptional regulator [Natrialbaceae archaeon]|jgi:DNA-binding Lrp family transcriptional regulator